MTSANENSYTLTGLQSGAFYQMYVTANSDYGEGDPSDVVTAKTYGKKTGLSKIDSVGPWCGCLWEWKTKEKCT